MMVKERLTIRDMPLHDCWKDMARIPGAYRGKGRTRIHRNTICKVSIGDRHKLLIIRGWDRSDAAIALDSSTRDDLGVHAGRTYEVEIHPVHWLGYWRWAWEAADPSNRIPAQISIISLVLGIIGLILGCAPLIYRLAYAAYSRMH